MAARIGKKGLLPLNDGYKFLDDRSTYVEFSKLS